MAMKDAQADVPTNPDVGRRAARWAWAINGTLFAIGLSVSIFAYSSVEAGRVLTSISQRNGSVWTETVESRLFSLPVFQFILFAGPLLMDLNWRRVQQMNREAEQVQRARGATIQDGDAALAQFFVCFGLVGAGIIVFLAALAAALSLR